MDDESEMKVEERRSGIERRLTSYSVCIPERRSGQDNRSDEGRRSKKKADATQVPKT